MDPNSGRPQFPILYLIIPIIIASAFAVPACDAILQAFDVEPIGGARIVAVAMTGVLIGVAILLVLLGIRRIGKK